jgi:hypothetical protein
MARRVEDLVWLYCPVGKCTVALPVPREPVPVPCPYHAGVSLQLLPQVQ